MGDVHETASEATMSNEHAELERLRAKVARVQALVDQWDGEIGAQEDHQSAAGIRAVEACMRDLMAALTEPTTEGRA